MVFVFVCVWGWTSVCLCGLWWAAWDLLNECYLSNIPTFPTVHLLLAFKPETACNHVSHILFSLSSVSCINLVSLLINWQFIYIIYSHLSSVGHLILHWHYLSRFTHLVEFLWSSTYCFCFRNWHNTWKNKKTKKKTTRFIFNYMIIIQTRCTQYHTQANYRPLLWRWQHKWLLTQRQY